MRRRLRRVLPFASLALVACAKNVQGPTDKAPATVSIATAASNTAPAAQPDSSAPSPADAATDGLPAPPAGWTRFTVVTPPETQNGPTSSIGGHEDPVSAGTVSLDEGPWTASAGEWQEEIIAVESGQTQVLGQILYPGDAIGLRGHTFGEVTALVTGTGIAFVAVGNIDMNAGAVIPDGPMFHVVRGADSPEVPIGGGGTARLAYSDNAIAVYHTSWSGARRQSSAKGLEVICVVKGGGRLVDAADPTLPIDSELPRAAPRIPVWIESGRAWTLLHDARSTEAYELFWPPIAARDLAQAP